MKSWEKDKKWSDKFMLEIKSILGMNLIAEAPIDEDSEHNTDLMILKLDSVRIACRIRKYQYLRYAEEFTIRSSRPSGVKTELTKVIEGWGDYFFYGFSNDSETNLLKWLIGDLKAFRIWFTRQISKNKGMMPGIAQKNYDNSSGFHAFKAFEIPDFVKWHNH